MYDSKNHQLDLFSADPSAKTPKKKTAFGNACFWAPCCCPDGAAREGRARRATAYLARTRGALPIRHRCSTALRRIAPDDLALDKIACQLPAAGKALARHDSVEADRLTGI